MGGSHDYLAVHLLLGRLAGDPCGPLVQEDAPRVSVLNNKYPCCNQAGRLSARSCVVKRKCPKCGKAWTVTVEHGELTSRMGSAYKARWVRTLPKASEAAKARAGQRVINILAGKSRAQVRQNAEEVVEQIADALIAEGVLV